MATRDTSPRIAPSIPTTLTEIWALSPAELEKILLGQGHNLTDNLQYDYALAAMILYNEGTLDLTVEANGWVTHPDWLTTMARTSDLRLGLATLQNSFRDKIGYLYALFGTAEGYLKIVWDEPDVATNLPFLEFQAAVRARNSPLINSITSLLIGIAKQDDRTEPGKFVGWIFRPLSLGHLDGGQHWATIRPNAPPKSMESMVDLVGPPVAASIVGNEPREFQIVRMWREIIGVHATLFPALQDHMAIFRLGEGYKRTLVDQRVLYPPGRVIDYLLAVDLSNQHPIVQAMYLYLVWELMSEFPGFVEQHRHLNEVISRHGLAELFAPMVSTETIAPHLIADVRLLLLEYVGIPPWPVFMRRVLAQYPVPPIL